jgi:hypothetical protein
MAEPKTKPTDEDPKVYLTTRAPEKFRDDALTLMDMFAEATGEPAVMWGESIIGFGQYLIPAGKGFNPWPLTAFSPRSTSLTLYVNAGLPAHADLVARLGPSKVSGGCLHLKSLDKIDQTVLKSLITASFTDMKARHCP